MTDSIIKVLLKSCVRKLGYVITRYDPARDAVEVMRSFFNSRNISVVLDVGANAGQFALQLRDMGYRERIVSFEPLSSAYKILERTAANDPKWMVQQCALGDQNGTAEINISGNSWSSSLLEMSKVHEEAAPESVYIGKEVITIMTLDSLFPSYVDRREQVFLKIDTQGYTKKVLDGAIESIKKIQCIFVEMSVLQLYSNEPLIGDVISLLYNKGFVLVSINPEFIDRKTGRLLQVNGLFARV